MTDGRQQHAGGCGGRTSGPRESAWHFYIFLCGDWEWASINFTPTMAWIEPPQPIASTRPSLFFASTLLALCGLARGLFDVAAQQLADSPRSDTLNAAFYAPFLLALVFGFVSSHTKRIAYTGLGFMTLGSGLLIAAAVMKNFSMVSLASGRGTSDRRHVASLRSYQSVLQHSDCPPTRSSPVRHAQRPTSPWLTASDPPREFSAQSWRARACSCEVTFRLRTLATSRWGRR